VTIAIIIASLVPLAAGFLRRAQPDR
jgi:hypothetical protein